MPKGRLLERVEAIRRQEVEKQRHSEVGHREAAQDLGLLWGVCTGYMYEDSVFLWIHLWGFCMIL